MWKKISSAAINTTKIRVLTNASPDSYSRLTEVEAWTALSVPQNVTWTNAAGVTTAGTSVTKTAADGWGNAGAASTQTITSSDGYVDITASETNTWRMCGLSHTDTNQDYTTIQFGLLEGADGNVYVFESGVQRGIFGSYVAGDHLRVSVESGVVKYKKNDTVFYTSTVAPSYPLLVDTSLYSAGSTLSNVVMSSGSATANIHWLVTDQLGTPRMVFDPTGSLASVSRHDYLPFGEELFAGTGGRTTTQGYSASDGVRQHFTGYEADAETGLNFAQARYQSPAQGRFTSVDPLGKSASVLNPQSFNRYTYVLNNPINMTDPTGMMGMVPDATMSWDTVSDIWANENNFGGPETGRSIIAAAEARHDRWVDIDRSGGDYGDDDYPQTSKDGDDIGPAGKGRHEATPETFGEETDVPGGGTNATSPQEGQLGPGIQTMIVVWGPSTINDFGHLSAITIQDDTSYSYEGTMHIIKPSSAFTHERSGGFFSGSQGIGRVLDFRDRQINATFQYNVKHGSDSCRIYDPGNAFGCNCVNNFRVAINSIRADLNQKYHLNLRPFRAIDPYSAGRYIG